MVGLPSHRPITYNADLTKRYSELPDRLWRRSVGRTARAGSVRTTKDAKRIPTTHSHYRGCHVYDQKIDAALSRSAPVRTRPSEITDRQTVEFTSSEVIRWHGDYIRSDVVYTSLTLYTQVGVQSMFLALGLVSK